MSTIILQNLALKFGLTVIIVKSWWEHFEFTSESQAESFFEENIDMIKATPFVKWVGGKRQILAQLSNYFPSEFNNYHEPFLGGGAVFFNLQKKQSFLSDVNAELINTYQVIKSKPKNLIKFLQTCEYEKSFYETIRAWDRQENWQEKYSKIERAGRFIYLNRTCFNGLYRVNSRGEFNVPMGSYKNPDFVQKQNILNASKLLNKTKATIENQSFDVVLKNAKFGDFVYFDPPYDTLTETANFTSYSKSGFGRDMQEKLAEVFKKLDKKGVKVMMSNHNTEFIREIYKDYLKGFKIVKARRNINSNASGRGEIEEIVVVNY